MRLKFCKWCKKATHHLNSTPTEAKVQRAFVGVLSIGVTELLGIYSTSRQCSECGKEVTNEY